MSWIVFSHSLPSHVHSSPRVALWRRLRGLGAISPTSGIYVLPARQECIEAFQWLAQEVQHAKGEALVMRVEQFEGLADAQLIERFREARRGVGRGGCPNGGTGATPRRVAETQGASADPGYPPEVVPTAC